MWMLYAEASRPQPTDVQSAVERLKSYFEDLAFDAAHESVYGLGQFGYTEEECNKLQQKYENGVIVCDLYLKQAIDKVKLIKLLNGLGLEEFLEDVNRFIEAEEEEEQNE